MVLGCSLQSLVRASDLALSARSFHSRWMQGEDLHQKAYRLDATAPVQTHWLPVGLGGALVS